MGGGPLSGSWDTGRAVGPARLCHHPRARPGSAAEADAAPKCGRCCSPGPARVERLLSRTKFAQSVIATGGSMLPCGRCSLNRISCAVFVVLWLSFDAGTGARESVILNPDAYFPEGPIWYRDKLYYVEYGRDTVTVWDGKTNSTFASVPGCGPSAIVPNRGEFILTCYDNGSIGRLSADGNVLPAYTHDKDGQKFLGPNDFAPDGHGGIYFTASGHPGPVIDGSVFYLAP